MRKVDPHPEFPAAALTLLGLALAPREREAVLGDALEDFQEQVGRLGARRARLECWREVLRSAPIFLAQRWMRFMLGREPTMDTRSGIRQALGGLLLALPALILVVGGVLQSTGVLADDIAGSLGGAAGSILRTLGHPAVILGGLLLAFAINARPILRLALRREQQALVGSVTVRGRLWNLLSVGLVAGLLAAILAYGFVENYRIVPTHAARPTMTSQFASMDSGGSPRTVLTVKPGTVMVFSPPSGP